MNKLSFDKGAPERSRPSHAKLVNRIDHWLSLATPEERTDGLSWYARAGEFCSIVAEECGFKPEAVAQCVAILSPQIDWEQNKRNAVLLATTLSAEITIFAGRVQKEKALASLTGEYSLGVSSRKTYSVAQNIADPASLRVTVDRHAVQAALNDAGVVDLRITDLRYRQVEAAYQAVAKKHGLLPYQVQAIVWVTYKRSVNR